MNTSGFDQYYDEAVEPGRRERAYAWATAIGLQDVDGLKPSKYLIATAKRHIEGEITQEEARRIVDAYYGSPIDILEREGRNYYFQFTLNDYDAEKIEPSVPRIEERIKTFTELSKRISHHARERIVWRFDAYRKDAGQRAACGCVMSKDIGEYNTCPYLCHYCHANANNAAALANWQRHLACPHAETITGR